MSSLPDVFEETAETHSAIDEGERTSRGSVSIPFEERFAIFDGFRALAKTRRPRVWNAKARASPRLPSEQPVMRTVFLEGMLCT